MRVNLGFLMLFMSIFIGSVGAQDFDADSIYYTPIPKTAAEIQLAERQQPKAVFKDTVSGEKFIQYFFNFSLGPLIGCTDCLGNKEVTFTTSTTHGITVGKKFRTGLGIGYDSYYRWNTMPLFASASWDVFGTRNTNALFVRFDVGYAVPRRKEEPWDYGGGGSTTGVNGGRMLTLMVGYKIKYHDMTISMSVGGKFQNVSYYVETPSYYYTWEGILVEGTSPHRTTVSEEMSRFMTTVAIGWK